MPLMTLNVKKSFFVVLFVVRFRTTLQQSIFSFQIPRLGDVFKLLTLYYFFLFSPNQSDQLEAMVLQGELLWDANKKPESFPIFLRSAQLNPSNWLPFLYLGRYYNSWAGKRDAEKARKCYLKSFNLNPRSTEAGTTLSDILREQVNT